MITLTSENKSEFIERLKLALIEKFGENLPENYGTEKPWSLLSLIQDNNIDTYQLLYVNNKIWSGAGGMIRELNGEKVYQASFRLFSIPDHRHRGLGVKPLTHMNITKFQIERAKSLGCKSIVLSFNDYNYQLFVLNQRYLLPKALPDCVFVPSEKPMMFNGVEQWLLTMTL